MENEENEIEAKKILVKAALINNGLSMEDIKFLFELDFDFYENDVEEIVESMLSEIKWAGVMSANMFG